MKKKTFSIITVCYNADSKIEETIKSVINQDYSYFEYIIVDGGSRDNTISIIEKYANKYNKIRFISEKDKGIYDAMNKGIKMAKNEYLYFLNAGDYFYSNSILSELTEKNYDSEIIYGDIVVGEEKKINNEKINLLFFLREKMICHQAIFAHKNVFINNEFDLKYRYCADRKWLMRAHKKNMSIKHFNGFVCFYDIEGISSSEENMNELYSESANIIKEEFGLLGIYLMQCKRLLGNLKKYLK